MAEGGKRRYRSRQTRSAHTQAAAVPSVGQVGGLGAGGGRKQRLVISHARHVRPLMRGRRPPHIDSQAAGRANPARLFNQAVGGVWWRSLEAEKSSHLVL